MHLTYNGYSHAENEVWMNISKRAIFAPRGGREKEIQRWDIMGVVIGTSESDLTSKMQALEVAYSTNGGDLLFYGNSNALTRHTLYSSQTLNGTKVERFDWLPGNSGRWGSGTEYVNKRSYHIVVTAETLWNTSDIYFYQSTISVTGTTGPKTVWMPSLTSSPQLQTVQSYTTQKIVQSGIVIGMTDYVLPDQPMFPPNVEHLDRRQSIRMTAQEIGVNQSLKFPWRWMYFFESPIPLVAI